MPSHAFMRVGAYDEAARSNVAAVALFAADAAPDARAHASYLGHDCEFGTWAFMMAGEHGQARSLAASSAAATGGWQPTPRPLRPLERSRARRRGNDLHARDVVGGNPQGRRRPRGCKDARRRALRRLERRGGPRAGTGRRERGDRAAEIASLEAATAKQDHLDDQEPPAWFYPVRSRSAPRISPPAATRTPSGPSTRACRRIRPTRAVSTGSQARSTGSAGRPTPRRPAAPSPPPGARRRTTDHGQPLAAGGILTAWRPSRSKAAR